MSCLARRSDTPEIAGIFDVADDLERGGDSQFLLGFRRVALLLPTPDTAAQRHPSPLTLAVLVRRNAIKNQSGAKGYPLQTCHTASESGVVS